MTPNPHDLDGEPIFVSKKDEHTPTCEKCIWWDRAVGRHRLRRCHSTGRMVTYYDTDCEGFVERTPTSVALTALDTALEQHRKYAEMQKLSLGVVSGGRDELLRENARK